MSDDIVTRLREWHTAWNWYLPDQAADEIERLRADVKRWRNWAEEYFYTDPDCECLLCDQVKAAINNG